MVAYTVTADVEPALAEDYEAFMIGKHIGEVLATNCFIGAEFEQASATRFQTRYLARSRTDLEFYLARHAPALRDDFVGHFPEGVKLAREVWAQVERWPR